MSFSFCVVPEGCEDPEVAMQSFSLCFTSRYGDLHPLFFVGSLADAVKEATGVPADHVRGVVMGVALRLQGFGVKKKNVLLFVPFAFQRKPLFIYLHHDQSVLSNIFCRYMYN